MRGRLEALRRESGFTLIEIVVASLLLFIVAAPLMTVFVAAQNSQRASRERTGADQLASAQIEQIRSLQYDDIGIVNGNPSGVISATPVANSVTGGKMNVSTKVTYVDDYVSGTVHTYADYKKVVVTVTRATDGKQLSQKTTVVSSPGAAPLGGVDYVTVKSNVLDYGLNAPVSGAGVTLSGGTTRTDTTPASGSVVFPALSAAAYTLAISMPGYVTLKDDASPATPSTCPSTTCVKGYTWNSTIRIYKPSTITVFLKNSSGNPFSGSSTVTAYSSRGSQTFAASGGTLTISSINGEQVVPNVAGGYTIAAQATGGLYSASVNKVVPNSYPNDLTSTYTLTLNTYTTKTLTVTVKKSGVTVSNAAVQVAGGPANTFLTGTTNSSGVATFTVPSGTGSYTVTSQSGAATGSATATVNGSNVAVTVNIA